MIHPPSIHGCRQMGTGTENTAGDLPCGTVKVEKKRGTTGGSDKAWSNRGRNVGDCVTRKWERSQWMSHVIGESERVQGCMDPYAISHFQTSPLFCLSGRWSPLISIGKFLTTRPHFSTSSHAARRPHLSGVHLADLTRRPYPLTSETKTACVSYTSCTLFQTSRRLLVRVTFGARHGNLGRYSGVRRWAGRVWTPNRCIDPLPGPFDCSGTVNLLQGWMGVREPVPSRDSLVLTSWPSICTDQITQLGGVMPASWTSKPFGRIVDC